MSVAPTFDRDEQQLRHLPESIAGRLSSPAANYAEHLRVSSPRRETDGLFPSRVLHMVVVSSISITAPPPPFMCRHEGFWPVSILGALVTSGLVVRLMLAIHRSTVSEAMNTVAAVLWIIVFIITLGIGYGGCML